MPRIKGRWVVPGLVCALGIACATEDEGNVADPTPGTGKGGSSAGTGGGGSGGSVTAGTSSGGGAGPSAGTAGAPAGGSAGSTAGSTGTAGTAGTTSAGAGGDTTAGGAGGDGPLAGAGGDTAGGAGGDVGTAGAGGAGGAGSGTCDDNIKNGTESHIDCGDSADMCGDCAFPLTRYVIGDTGDMGTVTMTWDATNLYYSFAIIDNTPQTDSAAHWEDDSVEIYLDLNNAKTATYQADDYQITIAREVTADIQGNESCDESKISVVRSSDANGYTLDVTIQWAALDGATAPLGQNIGFDFAVNNDTNGGTRESQITVFGTINDYQNTSAFGTITLN
jgi:hypothetical protein